jgi:hypothetical protein
VLHRPVELKVVFWVAVACIEFDRFSAEITSHLDRKSEQLRLDQLGCGFKLNFLKESL